MSSNQSTIALAAAAQKLHGSSATGITASERSLYDTNSLLSSVVNASPSGSDPEAWRAFGNDTETGRMMNRLYGGGSNKPQINYPTLKKRKPKNTDENAKWMPSSSGGNNTDPKSKTFFPVQLLQSILTPFHHLSCPRGIINSS